jgi:hypothetical protein
MGVGTTCISSVGIDAAAKATNNGLDCDYTAAASSRTRRSPTSARHAGTTGSST